MMLKGKIISGLQKAAFFVQLDWVQEQCNAKLGFKPYPGTLNLQVLPEDVPVIKEISKRDGIELTSPDPSFCSGKVLLATVEGLSAAIMIPEEEVRVHGNNIIEVIAPERLKDVLGVKEGDLVSLSVDFHQTQKKEERLSVDAVIFDLDGTLIDSTEIYFKIFETIFDNLDIPQIPRKNVLNASKDGAFSWDDILPIEIMDRKEEILFEAQKLRDEYYLKKIRTELEIIKGADEVLRQIASSPMKLGLVTTTPRQDLVHKLHPLKRAGVDNLFEATITTDDVKEIKPAAEPLVECGKRLGVTMNKSVYIGDACIDIRAGIAAGMKTIGVLTGFDDYESLKEEGPDAIIYSVRELWDVVLLE
jgi:HAD superfamily hydrolase (TIGR01509 family)